MYDWSEIEIKSPNSMWGLVPSYNKGLYSEEYVWFII